MRIVSGGQTGVDRAALDVALDHGIDCGGWCPEGRVDEFGQIPDRYPVQELPNGSSEARTRQNVVDSDGTVVFHHGELRGGTVYTVQCCAEQRKPYILIDAVTLSAEDAALQVARFIREQDIERLNVAGPRQSEWPHGYEFAAKALNRFLAQT